MYGKTCPSVSGWGNSDFASYWWSWCIEIYRSSQVRRQSDFFFWSWVCESDLFANEGDEVTIPPNRRLKFRGKTTTTNACSVVSECRVPRKFCCVVPVCKLFFLDQWMWMLWFATICVTPCILFDNQSLLSFKMLGRRQHTITQNSPIGGRCEDPLSELRKSLMCVSSHLTLFQGSLQR